MKFLVLFTYIFSSAAFAEITVQRFERECVNTSVEERNWDGVVTVHHSCATTGAVVELTKDSSRPDWRQSVLKGESKYESMRSDASGATPWKTLVESNIERKNESLTTQLSENTYRAVEFIELKSWSKPGYNFGQLPDGTPITYKESQLEFDSTYFDDGHITYGLTDRLDGVDVPAQKIVYEYSISQDGDAEVYVQRLTEPYTYADDSSIKVLSEETVCRRKNLD